MVDKIIELIKYFKSEFYNKITWAVVVVGLALIGTPLFEKIIKPILESQLSITIAESNDTYIGITLVCIGLCYNIVTVYIYKYLILKQQNHNSSDTIAVDREMFQKFLQDLPSNGTIEFLRSHSFENQFSLKKLEQIRESLYTWNNAEYEFLNVELETLKKVLFEKIDEFDYELATHSYSQPNGLFSTIPDLYQCEHVLPPHVMETINKLNNLASEIYELHQGFIREVKRKLNV